jgi:hypothetical protein
MRKTMCALGCVAVAVFTAAPAQAVPTMSGNYTETLTGGGGAPTTNKWEVFSCGDGCLNIYDNGSEKVSYTAHLSGNTWSMSGTGDIVCDSGKTISDATQVSWSWDADSLSGTSTNTEKANACGDGNSGGTYTLNMQLTKA